MKKVLLSCLVALLFFSVYSQQIDWQYLTDQKSATADYELVQSTENEIVVKFSQAAYGLKSVTTHKGSAYVIVSPDGTQIQKKGAPDLGKMTQSVIIPDNREMMLKIVDSKFVEIENIEIAPSKGIISRDKNPDKIPYEYGIEYETDAFYPSQIAYLRDPFIIRDFRGQTVVTQPFQYNPVKKVLRIYTEVTLQVVASDKDVKNPLIRKKALESVDSRFESIYKNHFLNFESGKYTPLAENGGKLLIISYDSFADEMQSFVNWKNSIGMQTELVNYSTIGSSSALKTYVQNYYNTNGLTFLLIVGDNAQVPTSSTSAGDSDNNYGYIVGSDHYLDIFVGRFSAENATQVTTQVNRTLYYERDMLSSAANISKGVGIASNEGTGGGGDNNESDEQHMNNIETDLENYGYNITRCYQDGGSTSQLSSLINTGTGIINYVGHGSNTSWAAPSFSSTNVNALTNTNKFPFVISVACVVGNFKSITCFAEAWLRATSGGNPTGAIVFCGSTINQSWASPMRAQDEMNDLLVANSFKSYGGIFVNGMFAMIDAYGSDGENMADTWTCFGDPSLYTRTPGHPDGPQQSTSCGVPSGLAASGISNSGATLSWNSVTDAQSYDCRYKATASSTWSTSSTSGTSVSLTALNASTEYEFQVRAVCASGTSDYSPSEIFTTLSDPNTCDIPTGLTESAVTQSSATLAWNAMANANSYDVRYKKTSESTWVDQNTTTTSVDISGLAAITTYEFQVRTNCTSGTTNYSASKTFTTLDNNPYCESSGNDFSYEWIAQVQVGTYSNSSGGAGFTNFTSEIIQLEAGKQASVTLTPGFASTAYSEYWKIWIDLNKDGDFADAGEELFSNNGNSAVTGTITVPATATGSTRLRVVMQYNAAPSSCGSFSYGETEDYTVTFTDVEPDTEPPSVPTGLATTSVGATSVSLSWNASTDNVGVKEYEVFVDGVSDGTSTTTSYTASGLQASTNYDFTVLARDDAGNESAQCAALNVLTDDVVITYCDASGTNQNYEWIAGVTIGSFTNNSAASGYSDFTSQNIAVVAGNSYNVTLTPEFASTAYNEYWKIWVDFNQDGDFADTGEELFSNSGNAAVTGSIAIPSTAEGETRLRVVMDYNSSISSCGSFTYGEVEDYTITITRSREADDIFDIISESSLRCFPNPTNGIFKLQVASAYTGQTQVAVFNTIGQVVRNITLNKSGNTEEVDMNLSNLPSGIYIINVKMDSEILNERIILE